MNLHIAHCVMEDQKHVRASIEQENTLNMTQNKEIWQQLRVMNYHKSDYHRQNYPENGLSP